MFSVINALSETLRIFEELAIAQPNQIHAISFYFSNEGKFKR